MPDKKEVQKQFYDKYFDKECAWDGHAFSESTRYFTDRFIEDILKAGSENILEIGCGNGLLTYFLLKKGVKITAIDISRKAIENMRKQFRSEITQGRLRLECGDLIEFLENSNETFDAIIGSGIIHHIEKSDWNRLFALSHKRLKPKGIFTCGPEPNAGGLYSICWRFAKYFYKIFGMDYDWEVEKGTLNMVPGTLKSFLKRAGFHNPEIAPFQAIPHFRIKILEYIDKKLIKYAKGRISFYITIRGKKQ